MTSGSLSEDDDDTDDDDSRGDDVGESEVSCDDVVDDDDSSDDDDAADVDDDDATQGGVRDATSCVTLGSTGVVSRSTVDPCPHTDSLVSITFCFPPMI